MWCLAVIRCVIYCWGCVQGVKGLLSGALGGEVGNLWEICLGKGGFMGFSGTDHPDSNAHWTKLLCNASVCKTGGFPLSCWNFPCPDSDPNHVCWEISALQTGELQILHPQILGWAAAMIPDPPGALWHVWLPPAPKENGIIGRNSSPKSLGWSNHLRNISGCAGSGLWHNQETLQCHQGTVQVSGWELQDPCPGHSGIIPVIRSYHKLNSPRAGICSIDGECICQLILSAKCVDFSEVRCEIFYICGSLNQQENDS